MTTRVTQRSLFRFIKPLPPTTVVGLPLNAQKSLLFHISQKNAKTVLDINPGLGSSTLFLAPQVDTVIAVEPWWMLQGELHVRQFLSNVIHAGMTEKVIPCSLSHKDVDMFDDVGDLVHINHLRSFEQCEPWLNHRLVCGSGNLLGTVVEELSVYAQKQNRILTVTDGFWARGSQK